MTPTDFFDAGGNWGSYMDWECYKAGMYESRQLQEVKIKNATLMFLSPVRTKSAMKRVTVEWRKSCDHHLTKYASNRRAWLGQAACFIGVGSTDDETKSAWNMLDRKCQDVANSIADEVIEKYDKDTSEQLTFMDGDV
jgi:hypothetical protein